MIRFLLGFLFSLALCCAWIFFRFAPQQMNWEMKYRECQLDQTIFFAKYSYEFMENHNAVR
jgi:hypothetical protein